VLEVAVFSDALGRWQLRLEANADYQLVAYREPEREDRRVSIRGGRDDIEDIDIIIDIDR